MRAPGKILLISCYELGHQPFQLASLLAMLQQAGYAPKAVDTTVDDLSDQDIKQASFIGISVPMHTALRLGHQIAQRIRTVNPAATICFYGLYALLNSEYLLQEQIDAAIGGEYEGPLLQLIASLEAGKNEPIPGVSSRQSRSGPSLQRTHFLVPERQHLPSLDKYAHLEVDGEARIAGYTETTRGCKHTCRHCPITPVYGGRFFAIPAEIVLADIRAQVAQGARHITFGDPDFLNGPTHALRILRVMHQEFPNLTFDATIKVEHLLKRREILPELKELGCAFIVSAVESINDAVLNYLDKGHTSADISEVFGLMENVDIPIRPSLLPFTPWETLDSFIDLLNFFEERQLIENVDPVHFSIRLLIPPGSSILEIPGSERWLDDLDSAAYSYRWHHPDPRMDTLQARIASYVEIADRDQADLIETFFGIKALALAARGEDLAVSEAIESYGKQKVLPHLTESWFC